MVKFFWAILAAAMVSQADAAYVQVGGQKIEYYREIAVPDMQSAFKAWRDSYYVSSTNLVVAQNSDGGLRLRKTQTHNTSAPCG